MKEQDKATERAEYQLTTNLYRHKALHRKFLRLCKRMDRRVAEVLRYAIDEYVQRHASTEANCPDRGEEEA